MVMKRCSIECRKTKTKVITTANQNKGKYHNGQSEQKENIKVNFDRVHNYSLNCILPYGPLKLD